MFSRALPQLVRAISTALGLLALAATAGAESGRPDAHASCRREPAPGRVLCEVEVEVRDGRLAWADALVVRAPDFARPLRSRIGPTNAVGGTDKRLRLPVALGATREGRGRIELAVRAVACVTRGGETHCTPSVRTVSAAVEVGGESH